MRDLKGATVYREGTANRDMAEQIYGVKAAAEGERLGISTYIPWGSGSSNVTVRIPPEGFRDLPFEMILADPATVHRAYASLGDVMLESIVRRARQRVD